MNYIIYKNDLIFKNVINLQAFKEYALLEDEQTTKRNYILYLESFG